MIWLSTWQDEASAARAAGALHQVETAYRRRLVPGGGERTSGPLDPRPVSLVRHRGDRVILVRAPRVDRRLELLAAGILRKALID